MTSSPSGAAIRAAYRHAGMNRSQFQRAMGVAYSTILNWERGRTRPNAHHLSLISQVTGVAVDDLLRQEPEPDVNGMDAVLAEFLRLPRRFLDDPALEVLHKPFTTDELLQAIERVLSSAG